MSKNRDGIRDVHPEAKRAEQRTDAPPPPLVVETGASTEALLRGLIQAVASLAGHQVQLSTALASVVGDREEFLAKERADVAKIERIRKECEKTAQQRTQEAADRKWPHGEGRYRVALMHAKKITNETTGKRQTLIVPDPAFPVIEINAASPEEADGRYRGLCGIVSTEGAIRATPLDETADVSRDVEVDEHLPEGVLAAV